MSLYVNTQIFQHELFFPVQGQHPCKSAHLWVCHAKQDWAHLQSVDCSFFRIPLESGVGSWVVVGRNLWGRWRLSMWQNILVSLCWIFSMWYLGCFCKIIWRKLTVDFVIRKAVPNFHAWNDQWLADQLQFLINPPVLRASWRSCPHILFFKLLTPQTSHKRHCLKHILFPTCYLLLPACPC